MKKKITIEADGRFKLEYDGGIPDSFDHLPPDEQEFYHLKQAAIKPLYERHTVGRDDSWLLRCEASKQACTDVNRIESSMSVKDGIKRFKRILRGDISHIIDAAA